MMKINENNLRWHLQNNVFPQLDEKTIDCILSDIEAFNRGELTLDSFIGDQEHEVTLGELIEDLKIEIE